ncbi:MAG: ribbon-helix-helix protein, CopG family [bacterium]
MAINKNMMSLRLPEETKTKLELLAEATDRNKSTLVLEAIDNYLDTQSWQISAIQEGIKQLDNGEYVAFDDVKAKWVNKKADNQ